MPVGNTSPTSNTDLATLVSACHDNGIRFLIDVVMAFGTHAPMENVNYPEFHIDPVRDPDDPDAQQSGGQGTSTDSAASCGGTDSCAMPPIR